MDFTQLYYFTVVAKEHSFTAAAKDLSLTQAALSLSMRRLENEIGIQLFNRSSHGIDLTAAGKKYRDTVEYMLVMQENTLSRLRREWSSKQRKILLETHLATAELAVLSDEYMKLHQDILITHKIVDMTNFTEEQKLANWYEADAFVATDIGVPEGFLVHTLEEIPLLVVLPESHPLAHKEQLHAADLVGESFLRTSDSSLMDTYNGFCRKYSLPAVHAVKCPSEASIARLISHGQGITITFAGNNFYRFFSNIRTIPLDQELVLHVNLICNQHGYKRNPVLSDYINFIEENFRRIQI